MRGEGNHKIPGSFAPENMEKTGAERVKYSLACQHEDAIPIKFVSYAQKCPTVLCTFAVALRKESVDRNVDTTTSCGAPVRVYLPHAGGNSNDITADKAEAIQQLETQRDVQIMRAIDAAADEIGADIQSATVRAALQKAIALNCKACRTWTYERLEVPGISRIEFYRRRRKYLENVAQRVGIG